MNTYDNEYQRQQILQAMIMRYGITYLDQLDLESLQELMDEEERYYE